MQPFFQGFTAPLRGLKVIASNPNTWGLAVLPIALSLVFLSAGIVAAVYSSGVVSQWLFPHLGPGFLHILARSSLVVLLGMLFGALAYMSASLLSIPINDAMSERVEEILGELPPALSLREALPRSIRHSVVGFFLWLTVELLLFPLQLVPGIGSLLGAVLSAMATAFFLSHQLLDGPMSRRAMSFREKMEFLQDHLPWSMGLGCGGALVMVIPLANLVALPVLIAGGAVLWVELEQERRAAL